MRKHYQEDQLPFHTHERLFAVRIRNPNFCAEYRSFYIQMPASFPVVDVGLVSDIFSVSNIHLVYFILFQSLVLIVQTYCLL